jgi:hypothetical protein
MGSYGRNFDFRVPPVHGQRGARYFLPSTAPADLPLGVPVRVADGAVPVDGRLPVALATGAQAPKKGMSGLLLFEYGPAAFSGFDPLLTTYSDLDKAPRGQAVQVIHGDAIMVAGMGATPTLAPGDLLTPGTGTDAGGYWAETADPTLAWLVVESVDAARQEVEARFAF